MEKISYKLAFLFVLIGLSNITFSMSNDKFDIAIIVDISEQRLYLHKNSLVIESFPISSSKYGEGSKENSFKTPLGDHKIKEKIGDNANLNTIFVSRINTHREAEIIDEQIDSDDDHVTSRILWLDGQEEGVNSGEGVDSFQRYIYIHGTHEEGLIGQKASHGCIRMFNDDVIYLYDMVKEGTKVYIRT
ncbi:MAG: hypothetical protein CMD40_00155 [Gammaproteobacteria bacterium]|nr:hypothetical protein [Gammaproteobacteria bacterium]